MTARCSGFTLVELIVSLTITGMVLTAGYTAFSTVVDRGEVARRALDEVIRSHAEREQLRNWIGAARLPFEQGGPAFTGLDATLDHQADDALTFLTSAPTPSASSEAVLALLVDRDEQTPARGLVAWITPWPGGPTAVVEIDPRVTELNVRYHSIPLGHRGWLPSWVSSTLLPTAVEITLAGDELPPLLRVPLLIPTGAGR